LQHYITELLTQHNFAFNNIVRKQKSAAGDKLIVNAKCMLSKKSVQVQVLNGEVTLLK
jgi:hypothetical protein